MSRLFKATLAIALLTVPTSLAAHTALRSSSPASGSVLEQSPPALTLTFLEPATLTSLTLVNASGERRLPFAPRTKERTFTSPKPVLVRGRNEVRWRALSQDGHVVEGSLIIVIRPPRS